MEIRYKEIEEIPENQRSVVERMIKNGILDIDENGQFNVSEDNLKIFVILARLGLI